MNGWLRRLRRAATRQRSALLRDSATSRRRAARGACAGLCVALAATSGCDQSPPDSGAVGMLRGGLDAASGGVVVEFDLSRGLSEEARQLSFFSGPSAPSLPELVQALGRAKNDRRTKGFFLSLGAAELSWAQAEELGRLFSSVVAEKPVVCHAHGYSNTTLFFAAQACDRKWLSPAGEVGTVGIAGQMLYLKRLLDRFKVKADFLHMGRYKSAAEMFTEDGPSEEARESLLSVLRSIRQTWLDGLRAAGAGDKLVHAVEHGPFSPEAALKEGLVDAVGYLSEARDDSKERSSVDDIETSVGVSARRDAADEITALIRALAGASPSEPTGEHVVVLPTAGGITMESSGVLGGEGIAAEPLSRTLRRLRKDDSVKAVVIRIDSPGGSALASDLLWHELMLLREKKPLIASLAGTAASGGYYMACAATRIVAERTTILGSIGVVGGKIVLGEALDELGVTGVTFPASDEPGAAERASYMSPLTAWDPATRESVRAQMEAIYELFLARVAKGRDLPIEQVRKVAEGRIWSGTQGLEHHLIDEFGGLADAILLAKKQAGLAEDVAVKIEGGPETLLEYLQLDSDEEDPEAIRAALGRQRSTPPGPFAGLAARYRPYADSLTPLLGRERVLATVPFAFQLE